MGWRPYWPLLGGILRAIGHIECKPDFSVSSFNDYDFALCILLEGVAKYFMSLRSSGAPPLSSPAAWQATCAQNIDLEW
eukprot:3202958-Pleurochrysis_carterae.AAC.1